MKKKVVEKRLEGTFFRLTFKQRVRSKNLCPIMTIMTDLQNCKGVSSYLVSSDLPRTTERAETDFFGSPTDF